MSTNQIDQLRHALHREAKDIEPVSLGLEHVVSRGRRRRNRGRALVAVGTATCVAGVGVTLLERGSGAPHRVAVAASGQSSAAATPTLEFRAVDGTVSHSTSHFTTAAGVTYALSTAPATDPQSSNPGFPGQAIYSTSDGEHWDTADQGRAWITDLSERGGVLYAIGTAPGAASPADLRYRVGTSHDGGTAWNDTELPFDLSAPSANVSLYRSSSVHIASSPTATVALLTEQFSPNLDAMVAARTAGHPSVEPRQTAAGFSLLDVSACAAAKVKIARKDPTALADLKARAGVKCTDPPVLGTITWSDLGLGGPGDLTREEMLVSTDGTHWSSAPAPATTSVRDLSADANGFLLLAGDETPMGSFPGTSPVSSTLLRSTDARVWTKVNTPPGLSVEAIAGERVVAYDPSGKVQTSTDGGNTWNPTDTKALLPAGAPAGSIATVDAGPLGFAVVVAADDRAKAPAASHDYLLFSADGINWTTSDLAADGEPADAYPTQLTVGADHVSVDYEAPGPKPGGPMKTTTLLATPKR